MSVTGGADGRGGGGDGRQPGGRAVNATPQDVREQVLLTAVGLAKHSGFPAVLLVSVFLFIALQRFLDSRDPKLALAPIHQQATLPFDPPPDPSPGARP